MRPETMPQDCDQALQELLPDQTRPVQKTLAAVLCSVIRARSVVLSRLARCAEYHRRTCEEERFRDLKRVGWQWQQSRVQAPERVQRLLLLLALARL